ncbi:unnamed protein product [Notodromas monacha]|uniref:CHCH domain-containing protein n=1 Tax=Notodromas monacha TaxID=399045 RepID=A0A7R9BV57_9CRUS|nr:unnamed protein product [Notodromas monacha]CAG0922313.1 unnamed protein product [Notodromas monacha]
MPFFTKSSTSSMSPQHPAPSSAASVAPQPPSMLKEMAATAGGVAVGSAVGHVVGHALTGAFSGPSAGATPAATHQPPIAAARELYPVKDGPCAQEIKKLLGCAVMTTGLGACQDLQDAFRSCMHGFQQQPFTSDEGGGLSQQIIYPYFHPSKTRHTRVAATRFGKRVLGRKKTGDHPLNHPFRHTGGSADHPFSPNACLVMAKGDSAVIDG